MSRRFTRGAVPRWAITVVATVGLAALVLAWFVVREVHITPVPLSYRGDGRPECPHDPEFDVKLIRAHTVVATTISGVPLSGPISDIPEFHDCQRFITDTGYGGLYAIYASDSLARLDSAVDTLSATMNDTAAVAAATIFSWSDEYQPLGIRRGFNCLYLSRQAGTWAAWLVPQGPDDPHCNRYDTHVNDAPGVVRLTATPTASGGNWDDYPPVARWDWDEKAREQFIGIRCGAAWCQVSKAGSSSPSLTGGPAWDPVPVSPPANQTRVYTIKGWFDAQLLAEKRDGRLQPSSTWGMIVPHPALGQLNKSTGLGTGWTHVATALVSADYHGLTLTLMTRQPNKIYLCDPSAGACEGPDPTVSCSDLVDTAKGENAWWSKVVNRQPIPWLPVLKRNVSVYRCVIGRPSTDAKVPGTARWRWLEEDETTWKRCDDGCCEVR